MTGFINSPVQVEIIEFLERVGPCPALVLAKKFGKKTNHHLWVLRSSGYIYNITLNKTEFWSLQGYGKFDPNYQKTFLEFLIKIEGEGGSFENGVITAVDGKQYAVSNKHGRVVLVDMRDGREYNTDDIRNHGKGNGCIASDSKPEENKENEIAKLFQRVIDLQSSMRTETDPTRKAELRKEFLETRDKLDKLT